MYFNNSRDVEMLVSVGHTISHLNSIGLSLSAEKKTHVKHFPVRLGEEKYKRFALTLLGLRLLRGYWA